ncbi:hypothetical protein EDD90_8804 [Streptomyces sp. Ag109_O5-1]|nr:hypothetical protein [Streptomyces sp. Ag109_O5-1]RPE45525.1 hypothetical protein EDD90_8804 [Streptomyces sp. Ag109_O5-1]
MVHHGRLDATRDRLTADGTAASADLVHRQLRRDLITVEEARPANA